MTTAADVMTEAQLQASIIAAARELGWLVYHTKDSRKSEPGFVDLVCVRPPRVLFIENKDAKGTLRKGRWNKAKTRWLPGQDTWRDALLACPSVEYMLVRPKDLDAVYRRLA